MLRRFLHKANRIAKTALARAGVLDGFRKPFNSVELETTAYCNRKCTYCPVSMDKRAGDEDGVYMSEKTFEKIMSDLKSMNFQGKIAPHLYGEPLSDPRLTRWMGRIRKELPQAIIRLVTNGDFLTRIKYHELIEAGVTYFDLSKHSHRWPPELEQLLSELTLEEKSKRLRIRDFWSDYQQQQEMLNTRGGMVKLKVVKEHPILCGYVTYPVINTFGDVVLCCNDYYSEHKFGNVNERHLLEIWQDPKNVRTRRQIYQGIFDLPICQNCYM